MARLGQEDGIALADLPIDRNYDLPTAGGGSERASALQSQFDRKRRAAGLAVPTADNEVRQRLRALGEPVTLFGEGPADRRDRLREVMLEELEDGGSPDVQMNDTQDGPEIEEEFYTEGVPELVTARKSIASFSLPRTRSRIKRQLEDSTIPLRTHIKHRKAVKEKLSGFELYGTQIAGDRPVSIVRFDASGTSIAVGNWSGQVKTLSVPNLEGTWTGRGHTGIVGGLAWMPESQSTANVKLASGAGGGQGSSNEICLWDCKQDTPLSTLTGHTGRVCRTEFHPSGRYLASASFDTTWRLWDIQTQQELLLQEGHSREVYAVSFNADGSLLASGGFDSMGRIWDLRSGRTVMILEGHIREIYSLDWGIDGYRVLSGSGDGWVKCWDLRAVRQMGQIGAHNGNVSDIRWYKGPDADLSMFAQHDTAMTDGHVEAGGPVGGAKADVQPRNAGTFFISSGFDKNVNVFGTDDWVMAKQLSGHSGNVLSCDVSSNAAWIVSSGHDRTVKLWGRNDSIPI